MDNEPTSDVKKSVHRRTFKKMLEYFENICKSEDQQIVH
jgi:hypothetical protein